MGSALAPKNKEDGGLCRGAIHGLGSAVTGPRNCVSLSADKIEAIRQGADILQVIGAVVDLRKKGQRFMGRCPFHSEKTPSFSVSPDKGLFYCFGCHAGGDIFGFVMRHEGLDFPGAARKLAGLAGVELAPESPEVIKRRRHEERVARANSFAQAFFEHALWDGGKGNEARAYLAERGIPEAFARSWKLGYGGEPSELVSYLQAKKVPAELSAQAGFLTEDGRRGLMDERLTFPILEPRGDRERVAGFGGRRLPRGKGPKYVNSRETALFVKRRLLYGWRHAEDAVRKSGRVVLVEGYLDVLACHRAGLQEAVAALGTAFTHEHAKVCSRLAKEAVLLFDADAAGQRAAREATERLVAAKLKALVAPLEDGEDPDSLVQKGGTPALDACVAKAEPAVERFIVGAFEPGMSIEDRVRAATGLASLIFSLGSGLERELYTARLAERVGVSQERLEAHLKQAPRPKRRIEQPAEPATPAPTGDDSAGPPPAPTGVELAMLRDLLLYPQLRGRLGELAEYASDPMRALLLELGASEEPLADVLARHLEDTRLVAKLAGISPALHESTEEASENAQRTLHDLLNRLKERALRAAKKEVLRELQQAEAEGEAAKAEELARRAGNLTRRKLELRRLGSSASEG